VVWRDASLLPEDLVFRVTYLGGDMPTFALNFSRPGAQVLLRYYLFLRLGRAGYARVHGAGSDVARYLARKIGQMEPFELWNDASDIPVFAWTLREDPARGWTLHDLSDRLRMHGWLIPAYPMPVDLTEITVQRIVVRNGLSRDLADKLLTDIATEVRVLDQVDATRTGHRSGFAH
jgi:glutamate decarboxylase